MSETDEDEGELFPVRTVWLLVYGGGCAAFGVDWRDRVIGGTRRLADYVQCDLEGNHPHPNTKF